MERGGHLLAVEARLDRFTECRCGVNLFLRKQLQEMRAERHVAPVADVIGNAAVAVLQTITNPTGRDGPVRFGGGLEQRGKEGQNSRSVGTGAFRENGDWQALRDDLGEGCLQLSDVSFAFATDEERASATRERANGGPILHFGFGEKDLAVGAREDNNIEIAQMIAGEQAGFRWRAANGHFDVEQAKVSNSPTMTPIRALLHPALAMNSQVIVDESARCDPEEADEFEDGAQG